MKKLEIEQAEQIRKKFLPNWEIRKGTYLYKKIALDDYNTVLRFLMFLEKPQIKLDHFADFMNFYNEVTIAITTHDVKGLTELDFELALYVENAIQKMGGRQLEENLNEGKYSTAFLKKLIAKAEALADKDFSQYTPQDHAFMDKFFGYHLPNMLNQFGELAGLATPLMQSQYYESWSAKYKKSINCSNPKGFSQKAHCAGRKKTESKEDKEKMSGFDPETVRALIALRRKFPQANDPLDALLKAVAVNDRDSDTNDLNHDLKLTALDDKIKDLEKQVKTLKRGK